MIDSSRTQKAVPRNNCTKETKGGRAAYAVLQLTSFTQFLTSEDGHTTTAFRHSALRWRSTQVHSAIAVAVFPSPISSARMAPRPSYLSGRAAAARIRISIARETRKKRTRAEREENKLSGTLREEGS